MWWLFSILICFLIVLAIATLPAKSKRNGLPGRRVGAGTRVKEDPKRSSDQGVQFQAPEDPNEQGTDPHFRL